MNTKLKAICINNEDYIGQLTLDKEYEISTQTAIFESDLYAVFIDDNGAVAMCHLSRFRIMMLHKINKLNNIYEYLMSNLSDTDEHNKLLESLLGIVEDLENEFEEKL